jgi:hypothetical protein
LIGVAEVGGENGPVHAGSGITVELLSYVRGRLGDSAIDN